MATAADLLAAGADPTALFAATAAGGEGEGGAFSESLEDESYNFTQEQQEIMGVLFQAANSLNCNY
jgi:hypothetical protein